MLAGYTGKYGRYEIERKFLLHTFPIGFSMEFQDLEDTYLPDSSLRLRIVKSPQGSILSRNLTQKNPSPGCHPSVSMMTSLYLSERDLAALGKLKGAMIEKRRHLIESESNRVTVDIFKGLLVGLILAEVEFRSETERDSYIPPADWTEVTGNASFACGFMAFHLDDTAKLISHLPARRKL